MSVSLRAAFFAVVAAGAFPAVAAAHRMDVAVTADATAVRVVVGYDDETPGEGASVTLTDAAGREVAAGTTDATGLCVFPRPPGGSYFVSANDHAGHKVHRLPLTIPASEAELASAATVKRNRWLMTAAGLTIIAGLTVALKRVVRK
jgi:nickel transport protein